VSGLNENNFFDNVGGSGAPSAKLQQPEDFVFGEVVDQFMAPATDFSTKKVKVDREGKEIEQLVVILQTDLRNWEGVTRIPKVDKDDQSSADKPGSDDDGKRAVYVEPWTNIHAAIGKAIIEGTGAKGPVRNGAQLGVKITGLKDTGKGNPLKLHEAKYVPPAATSSAFFDKTPEAESAPEQQAPTMAPAAEEQKAAPADPWATPATQSGGEQPKKAPF
jgi:hypothetical protein